MFSNVIREALEREVVGQPRAIGSVVRGVTRVASGLTPRERSWCSYLFMGPTGTGKTHLIRALARTLHGPERNLVVADCTQFSQGDPWLAFATQLAPLFVIPQPDGGGSFLAAPPMSIIQIEYLERGPGELSKALGVALETGYVMLPEGRRGSLRNTLVFVTTGLCSREILEDTTAIGFQGTGDEDDEQEYRVDRFCQEQAEKAFGSDLVGRLDGVVVFRPLEQEQLGQILNQLSTRVNLWLALRGFRFELLPEAREFLLARGVLDLKRGARDLIRAHQRHVEFPLADLVVSERIPTGGMVQVGRTNSEDHLHFEVIAADASPLVEVEVPIAWEAGNDEYGRATTGPADSRPRA